ncbi:MAG TPA: glycosyltransferase family 4 protein [Vicinamibacterales bacterium]
MPAQAVALCEGLASEGWRVVRIRTNLGENRAAQWLDGIRGIRTIVRAPVFVWRLTANMLRVRIVHILTGSWLSFFLFALPAICLGRAARRKVVLHYHGGDAERFFEAWPNVVRYALRRCDDVVIPSGHLQPAFAAAGAGAIAIPNICATSRFAYDVDRPLSRTCIVARHLEPIYNVETVIRAFALIKVKHPDAMLAIAGGGSEEQRLRELAVALGLDAAVRFYGYIPNERMPALYGECGVFLNASRVDNAPVAILEAFAAGNPVVSSNVGGIPHMVVDGVTGFLMSPDDHRTMADRTCQLLEDAGLARGVRAMARQAAAAHEWPSVYRQLMDLPSYASALARPLNG